MLPYFVYRTPLQHGSINLFITFILLLYYQPAVFITDTIDIVDIIVIEECLLIKLKFVLKTSSYLGILSLSQNCVLRVLLRLLLSSKSSVPRLGVLPGLSVFFAVPSFFSVMEPE